KMCHSMTAQYRHIMRQVITLICALSICMASVACLVRILKPSKNDGMSQPYVRYPVEYDAEPVLLMNSFANAFSFLSMIMIVNCTLVLLYKGGYTNVIKAWLMTGSGVLLFVVTYYYMGRCVYYFNFPMDHLSCSFIVWNIGMTGMGTLYYKGPFVMHQGFVIYVSILMAVVLEESFPEWTAWILMILVSLWDMFAVLCVIGPLRMLIETAHERNEPLFPALLFSTSSAWCYDLSAQTPTNAEKLPRRLLNFRGSTNTEDSFVVSRMKAIQEIRRQEDVLCSHHHHHTHQPRHHRQRRQDAAAPEDTGMKMGLGDFIFYSILVGKASRHGTVSAVVICYIYVVIGIILTLALLVIAQKPVPALPLSISLGMFAYFSTISFVEPFMEETGVLSL
ncbi:presenilin, putative, partial [Ixodes scapularis]